MKRRASRERHRPEKSARRGYSGRGLSWPATNADRFTASAATQIACSPGRRITLNRLVTGRTAPVAPESSGIRSHPFVSVIVPVRNEGQFIASTLAQLLAQDYPADRFEILVADGQSTDDTRTIVNAVAALHPNVRLLDNPRQLSSAGRNVAIRASRGEILLLVDGHCQIDEPRHLTHLVRAFLDSGADSVGRPQPLDVTGASSLQRAIAVARSCWLGHHPASHVYSTREGFVPPQSVAVAYRREVFDQIGLFDERFDACEDFEFNHRLASAGYTCFFTPGVAVRYYPRDSVGKLARQMIRYGRGRVRLLRKHPRTFSLPVFVPALFVAGLALGPALASLFGALWFVYLGTLAVYASLLLATSLVLAGRGRDWVLAVLLPIVFVTVHLGAGLGVWWEIANVRRGERMHHDDDPVVPDAVR